MSADLKNELKNELKKTVQQALAEDMPMGDITTSSLALTEIKGRARLIAKEDLVLSGSEPFQLAFQTLDPNTHIDWHFQPGQFIFRGQTICSLRSSYPSLLSAERVALNFLGRLSGIASLTRCYVEQVQHTKCKILDTRKTTPGLRSLEKQAVRHGGGVNHRMNLSDAILVKENHIQAMGGITPTLSLLQKIGRQQIEIEVRSVDELNEALKFKIYRVLLDNMSNEILREAVAIIPSHIQSEASGNMTLDRVRSVAELGVDFISVGALTHSAPCADVSMLINS